MLRIYPQRLDTLGVLALSAALLLPAKLLFSEIAPFPVEAAPEWTRYRANSVKLLKLRGKGFEGEDVESTYKARGDNRILVLEELRGGHWTGTVWGRNGQYWFTLTRRARGQPWVLTFLALKSRGDDGSSVDLYLNASDGGYQNYAMGLYRYPIDDLVKLKSFRATSVAPDEHRASVKWINFTVNPDEQVDSDDTAFYHGGRVALDSARAWLPVQAELNCSTSVTRFTGADFQEENGQWYAGRTEFVTKKLATGREYHRYDTVVEINTRDAPPVKEFFLSDFGLPEPQVQASPLLPYLWLAVIGAFLIAAGLYLRRRYAAVAP